MSELIDDLLTLSRISRTAITRTPVDLTAVASRVAGDLARAHSRTVKTTIAPGLTANADARLMQIVFDNLLGNAWKFSGKTEATVQRIVRRHGGRVWANATVNGGATIYFTLPD